MNALLLLTLSVLCFFASAEPKLSDFTALGPRGRERKLSDFDAKVVLVVNVASKCGFTPQYEGLQALYDEYKSQGFNVLAFPCNQFGGQEPDSNKEIQKFVRSTYKVKFPILAKVDVNGADAHPLFKHLTAATANRVPKAGWNPGTPDKDVQWNFTKFLLVNGVLVKRYSFDVEPDQIKLDIEKALGTQTDL